MDRFKKLEEYDISLLSIINMIPGHVYLKDKNGRYLWCNDQQVLSLKLSSRNEIIGKTDQELKKKEEADFLQKIDANVIKTGNSITVEEPAILEDGSKIFYMSKKAPLLDKSGNIIGIIGTSFDLSEQKKEFETLMKLKEQSEETLEKIIALMPGHVYWKDKNGVYLGCNDLQARNLGLKNRFDIFGKTDFDLTKDKKLARIFRENDLLVVNSGKPIAVEETVIINNKPAIMLSEKVPLINNDGAIIGMVGISVNVTELKNTQDKLQQTEFLLHGMSLLSASIAHELRTPLAAITMTASSLGRYFDILVEAYKEIRLMNHSIEFISDDTLNLINDGIYRIERAAAASNQTISLILNNLILEEKRNMPKNFCSIKECILESIDEYTYPLGNKNKIDINKLDDFKFLGDKSIVKYIFFNLMKNSFYFIEKAGKGEISIWNSQTDTYNQIHFRDTGLGISKEKIPFIFNKFYTDNTHRGTGIGLAFCKLVMEKIDGAIECDSKLGECTEFILQFPKIE